MYYIVGVLLLLGILVFIHEFGHFYVAKLCGMKVETFSIGMGPKFLKFRRGETEYALSWVPFGGYVKILGQDPREEIPPGDEKRSFSKMSIWKRLAVVIAGPVSNFILAFFVFWFLFTKGFPSPSAIVHFVHPGSPAAQAGFIAGDKVISVKAGDTQKDIRELQDLQRFLRLYSVPTLNIAVERDGKEEHFNVEAKPGKLMDAMSGMERDSLVIPGVEFQSYPPLYTAAGKGFFIVESFLEDGKKVDIDSNFQLEKALTVATAKNQELKVYTRTIGLEADASGQSKVSEPQELTLSAGKTLKDAGFVPAHLLITQIQKDSAAEKLGLKTGDILTELNGEATWTFAQFRSRLQDFAASGGPLKLKWLRDGKEMDGVFTPQHVDNENPVTQVKEKKFQLGAMFVGFSESSFEKVKAKSFSDGFHLAWDKTLNMSVSIVESFSLLITGKVSMKAMGGPVMIGKIAGDSLRLGWDYFLKMLAFISLNLCIMNLLPLPVLDGGHIILFCVEGVTRKPIPVRFIEGWATTGFFFLIGLALFVTFNDLTKLNFLAPLLKLIGK